MFEVATQKIEEYQHRGLVVEIVNSCFCQWKVGGSHQKAKGNIWKVMFTDVFSPFPQKYVLLFQFHAGNGSSVCQRLTLQRGSRETEADRRKERA